MTAKRNKTNHDMKNKTILFAILGVFCILVLSYLFKQGVNTHPVTTNKKLQITTSFYPLYYFASQIGGNKVEVKNITPSGAEPHDYDPSTQDIARIENSNMLVLNGGVESWGDKIRDNLKGTKVKIVVAGQGLLNQQLTENGQAQTDPHVWLDPQLAKKEAWAITQAMVSIDPTNSTYYENNEKNLDKKLDQLNAAYQQGLRICQQKDIVTSHAAFGYLATRYHLNQVSIAGLSPDAEPSAQQLAEVTKFAKEHNVKYIFFESLVSPKLSQTIASEVGAQTMVLDPIEGVSADDIKAGKDYYTSMQDNLKNLQIALQCSK